MRQGQQNRRGRGRNNNNNNNNQGRKGQNPLTRSFESTGPDIKIRGTPAHIAEKYMALARDAQSSGDPVLAENYLQHAEHYNRIIMTYREQQMLQGGGEMQNGAARPARPEGFGEDDEEGDFSSEQPQQPSYAQQPRGEGRHDDRGHRGGHDGGGRSFHGRDRDRGERFQRGDRQDRDRDRGERPERSDRSERNERPERVERAERPDRAPQPDIGIEGGGQTPPRRERERQPALPHDEQPAFLRRPVRRQRREAPAEEAAAPTPAPAVESSGE
ncbi:hypothetical protein W911_03240 [Hyphomicrobium nitrativorans NL23]|uniref:DUF4167 domain-containing protein n=1 Tax=Hyphomicrobium nitrativorans NL23 TaxID=1029756 RepID=V5SCF6_9HYPH|nr:DUF4167 domain-containing protein [Hyphomicrobium nitrativorans]AHB47654.1 hypothetical protein W911_03240 [Hyphomicrobium nitrativorans NL23]